mgnify:FL=1
MRTHIISYLNKKGYKVNSKALEIIDTCDKWYRVELIDDFNKRSTVNNVDYEMARSGFAKRACEDDANLCEIVEVRLEEEGANKFVSTLLDAEKFQDNIREQLELIAAEGTVATYARVVGADVLETQEVRGGKIELVYVRPSGIFPLKVEKGTITECAFASEDVENNKARTTIVMFTLEDGAYKSTTAVLDEQGNEIRERHVDIVLGEVKPFALLTTAAVNNLKDMQGYGLPKIYGAIPELKGVDLIFNVFFGDLDKADKMILYNEALCDFDKNGKPITPNKQHKKTFVSIGKALPEQKTLIQEVNPEIRIDDITKTFELVLSLLSLKFGYGSRKYSFENGQIKTATEYIGTKQDSMQELNKQRQKLTDYIGDIIKALLWFSNATSNTKYDLSVEINIEYDDSYIIDRQSELEAMRQDAQTFGLPKLVTYYLQEKYNLSEEEASAWYASGGAEANPTEPIEE